MEEKQPLPVIKILLLSLSVLLLIALADLVLIETGNPLFGAPLKLKQDNRALQAQVNKLSALERIVDSLDNDNQILREQIPSENGVFYEVQIGAFQDFDLGKYKEELVRLKIEENDELKKYIIARFTSLKRAKTFLSDIQRMGIQDAFIVANVNGERTTIESTIRN
jgi:hypothetical protein